LLAQVAIAKEGGGKKGTEAGAEAGAEAPIKGFKAGDTVNVRGEDYKVMSHKGEGFKDSEVKRMALVMKLVDKKVLLYLLLLYYCIPCI